MHTLWNNFIYEPIYNSLVFIAQHVTFKDVGLAVILLTVIIRLIILPLSKKSIVSQYKMKLLEPKLAEIKAKKLSKEEESKQTFALYKQEKINPFSGCLYLLIQLPILFALYYVFIKGIYQPDHLYSALSIDGLKNTFLGLFDITKPFLALAILAGVTQAIQAFLAPKPTTPGADEKGFQASFTKSLSLQTRYVLPLIIIFIASKLAAAVSLYWTVANLFSIAQELYFRKTVRSKLAATS
ncbi:MAG TPA: YidC/Oxa1 family membrane protein insertase [Candidatus Paceibacterota bacterium]|nr:YidC/Oxa1 family membrane protein insertase [Candidatus Paceibacterota bacterium]